MSNKIFLVQDDYLQVRGTLPHLTGYGDVQVISNEHSFRRAIGELAKSRQLPLKLAVIDPLLRWADPAQDMPEPPADVREGGYFKAGVRCYKWIRDAETQTASGQTPVILLSTLDPERVDGMVRMFSRTSGDPLDYQCVEKSAELAELDDAVKRILEA